MKSKEENSLHISSLDHIVLCVTNLAETLRFYQEVLGLEAREERPGKWALHFGNNKISLQEVGSVPDIATNTTPGSGNFCVLTTTPIGEVIEHLQSHKVNIVDGPGERIGAVGVILSVYFNDPDGNLIEVSNQI